MARDKSHNINQFFLRNCNGEHMCSIAAAELHQLFDSGEAEPIYRNGKIRGAQLRSKVSVIRSSQATIRKSEVQANAFQVFKDGRSRTARMNEETKRVRESTDLAPEDFIERTAKKIGLWPLVFDEKAPRVGPPKEAANLKLARELGFAV